MELSYAKGKLIGNQPFPAVVSTFDFRLANMVASFKSDLSCIEAFSCLLHPLQLVIEEYSFELASEKDVIEKCHRFCHQKM